MKGGSYNYKGHDISSSCSLAYGNALVEFASNVK